MDKHTALRKYFGHSSFRGGQETLIDAILAGQDAFGIMPTGGGKSICYQIPAVLMEGLTIVVSPLISLMKDQVVALRNNGISAAYINSSLTQEHIRIATANMMAGKYKIVYVAPERLTGDGFVNVTRNLKISLVAVDEAHCISNWGQDFRPSYLKIVEFLDILPQRPVLAAFTATATMRVREDIERILKLREPVRLVTSFDRPNLYFEVLKPKSKPKTMLALLEGQYGKTGIIYCSTRATVERVCDDLCAVGVSATRYHAGLNDEERRENQEDFLYDRKTVMVATNAFGMGIDKSNVGFVIHYNMPKSLEAYYQEAGRAGRDGENADCVLMYSSDDIKTAKYLINNSHENDELSEKERRVVIEQDRLRLETMIGYCDTEKCLREYILDYFGQKFNKACGNCGNCSSDYSVLDMTQHAQMILSCVKRTKDKLGYNVGASLTSNILYGSANSRVRGLGLDSITTYAIMDDIPEAQIKERIKHLERSGYLVTDPLHGGISLTSSADNVLFRNERVNIAVRDSSNGILFRNAKNAVRDYGGETELFTALKALRLRIAKRESVPAFIIFSNATLTDMAHKAPVTMAEFRNVSGVGEAKASRYGKDFLEVISRYSK